MIYVYVDSEYNDDLVLCFSAEVEGERHDFDTRKSPDAFKAFVDQHRADIWVAYSVAAEQTAMLRLGVEPPTQWFDLMPECAQITMTHPRFRVVEVQDRDGDPFHVNPRAMGLLDACHHLLGTAASKATKDAMRDLILSKVEWSDEEFANIVEYCWSDVACLKPLREAVEAFHKSVGSPWKLSDALYRGKTTLNLSTLLWRSSGFPVDVDWLSTIYANRSFIIQEDAKQTNRGYAGYDLFKITDDGAKEDRAECERYAKAFNLPWERTEKSGQLSFKEDYLDTFVKSCPSLRPFKETRDLIIQLRKNRWTEGNAADFQRPLIQDGSVKAVSIPFYTKTGRSQPLVNRGHILNARPFIRTAIRPPEGKVVIAGDWSQQEIAIALHFFPDDQLRAAYETPAPIGEKKGKRDIYTNLALLAGALNLLSDDEACEFMRQQFKSVQLGLAYGMGAESLGRKMFTDLNRSHDKLIMSLDQACASAVEIYEWHRDTFSDYWEGVADFVEDTRERGWFMSKDAWLYFADEDTQTTQLQNITMQANGATMMHFATNAVAKTDLDFLAEHHDALYILSDEDRAEADGKLLVEIMNDASRKTIGDDIKIDVGLKTYNHSTGYTDPRATRMVAKLNNLITT